MCGFGVGPPRTTAANPHARVRGVIVVNVAQSIRGQSDIYKQIVDNPVLIIRPENCNASDTWLTLRYDRHDGE